MGSDNAEYHLIKENLPEIKINQEILIILPIYSN